MKKYAVIVAGGSGQRMGADKPKQFLLLQGRPVLWHTLHAFLSAYDDLQIILVLPAAHMQEGKTLLQTMPDPARIQLAEGGATRYHSVGNGLARVPEEAVVFVHDGVRCLVTPALIHRCYTTTLEKGNAVPAVSAIDTIRIADAQGNRQVDRDTIRIIQTPQTFLASTLKKAFDRPWDESFTDEANVVEQLGETIQLVEGERTNIKITQPMDLLLAEKILENRATGH
ncbi:MAG: 2-C-methyl-D-erythritol 4-phosphate cytidylyltransferase [Bacteroidetes bacterium]|nr:2-C-methyl-D-erythritol 4-phosphate cytidylyltransferase [Bacteroidota bacterium]